MELSRLCRDALGTPGSRWPLQGDTVAGRSTIHLHRSGHASLDGAGVGTPGKSRVSTGKSPGLSRWSDPARGGGTAPDRLRQDRPGDRRRAFYRCADRFHPRGKHPEQDQLRQPYRGGVIRQPARSGIGRSTLCKLAQISPLKTSRQIRLSADRNLSPAQPSAPVFCPRLSCACPIRLQDGTT